MIIQAEKDKM